MIYYKLFLNLRYHGMKLLKRIIFLSLLLLGFFPRVYAQDKRGSESVVIYFQKEKAIYDEEYRDNGIRLEEFFEKVQGYQSASRLVEIRIESIGTSSPEGDPLFNEIISNERQESLKKHILSNVDLPGHLFTQNHISQDWDLLASLIEADPNVTSKDRILDIVRNGGEDRLERMQEVEYARPFWYIYHNIFPDMRACRITVYFKIADPVRSISPVRQNSIEVPYLNEIRWERPAVAPVSYEVHEADEAPEVEEKTVSEKITVRETTSRKFTLKTNAIGWGLSAMNVAAEVDIADNWSVHIPFYYSGLNYFTETIKFRGAVLQPEIRYHIPKVEGLYAGAHLGVGWFNYALGGTYRIQDAGGKRPTWGGGLGVGYKMHFRKNPRWGMEFAVGAGVYDARYDKFYNEHNGPYVEKNVHKVFVGIDNASVSFTYSFDLKKKEDKR